MIKKILIILAAVLILASAIGLCARAEVGVSLLINGKLIDCDVAPVIKNSRTLVPARVFFEEFGSAVKWNEALRQVTVTNTDSTMIFNIDSTVMYLNGKKTIMDVAPIIIESRTMLPARFISEKLGYDVEWDNISRTVIITQVKAPEVPKKEEDEPIADNRTKLISVAGEKNTKTYKITIKLEKKITPKIMTLKEPDRLIFDFYDVNQTIKDGNIKTAPEPIAEVRWAEHPEYTRLVIEGTDKLSYSIAYKNSRDCVISIETDSASLDSDADKKDEDITSDGESAPPPKRDPNLPPLVVLDAGHGGYDPGAVGRDEEGNDVLYEKDVCLDIAKQVKSLLESYGIEVLMTRDKDIALGDTEAEDLNKRAEIANNADATLFVSIHNNAFTNEKPNGTCVLYAGLSTDADYGTTGKTLARNIQDEMLSATGLYDRGLVESPGMAVLRKTKMPAVLIECAFITNPSDREMLASKTGRQKMSKAIYNGIVRTLNNMK